MSLRFISSQSQYFEIERALIASPPFSVSCWWWAVTGSTGELFSIVDPAVSNHFYRIRFNSTPNLYVSVRAGSPGESYAWGQGGLSFPGWNHVAGVWRSSSYGNPGRIAYAATTKYGDNNVIIPSNLSRTTIGALRNSAPVYGSAKIGHVALWNTVLADDEIRRLSAGACPYDIKREFLVFYEPLAITGRFPLDKSGGFTRFGTTLPQYDSDPPVNTHSTSRYVIVPTGAALKGKITAADAEITYSTIKGQITAADVEATYSTVLGKITAADAEITYNLRSGKITAADLDLTYDPIKARITATDSEITYSTVVGKITAADLDITYTPIAGKVTAVDAEITYSVTGVPTGRITAADAEITYSTVSGKITAVDAEATYDTVKGKVTAADAEITYTPRGSKVTAADIEITYTPVAAKVTAADAEITYDPVIAKITASDAEITYDPVKGKIVAADAEITYTIAGQAARITAADLVITFSTTEYQQFWPKIPRRGSYLIPHREPRLLGSPRRKET